MPTTSNIEIQDSGRPRVVIVGGGFGGVRAARTLSSAPVDVVLIDRSNHHLFQPLLYQVATSSLAPHNIASPIRHIFRNSPSVMVLQGEVTSVDPARKAFTVKDAAAPIRFDYLVLATGVGGTYFGHDEFAAHAPGLKSLSDATLARNRILQAFESCERQIDPASHPELITFVLVGAGPTGVEMAGAIAEMARNTLASEFRRHDPSSLRVVLVEAGPRILATFPEELSRKAQARLEQVGVEVRLNASVDLVDATGVVVKGERIPSQCVFWTAGVKASPLLGTLGVPVDRAGRLQVGPDCSVPGHPDIFVIGDTASYMANGTPLPGVAQVAIQQGAYVGKVIARRVASQPAPPPFKYFDKGNMATIGRGYAILDGFGLRMAGRMASMAWAVIHVQFLAMNTMRLGTIAQWVISALTNQRTARLIIEPQEAGGLPPE
jgi:NADH:ubiquinone reductase (H+-translocating)